MQHPAQQTGNLLCFSFTIGTMNRLRDYFEMRSDCGGLNQMFICMFAQWLSIPLCFFMHLW